jgi:hypothetical protein
MKFSNRKLEKNDTFRNHTVQIDSVPWNCYYDTTTKWQTNYASWTIREDRLCMSPFQEIVVRNFLFSFIVEAGSIYVYQIIFPWSAFDSPFIIVSSASNDKQNAELVGLR